MHGNKEKEGTAHLKHMLNAGCAYHGQEIFFIALKAISFKLSLIKRDDAMTRS